MTKIPGELFHEDDMTCQWQIVSTLIGSFDSLGKGKSLNRLILNERRETGGTAHTLAKPEEEEHWSVLLKKKCPLKWRTRDPAF